MSGINSLPSERVAIIGVIDPDAYAAAAYNTGLVAVGNFHRLQAIVQVGDIVATGTVNAKLQGAIGSGGSPVDIPGAAITQLTQAGSDSNKQAVINLNLDSLAGTGYDHVQLVVTLGTAGADMGALLLGFDPRSAPASDYDAATVDEIVSA